MLQQGAWCLCMSDSGACTRCLVEINFLCCILSFRVLSKFLCAVNRTRRGVTLRWGTWGGQGWLANRRGHSPAGLLPHGVDRASWQSASGCHSCESCTRTPDPTTGQKATGVSLRGQRLKARTQLCMSALSVSRCSASDRRLCCAFQVFIRALCPIIMLKLNFITMSLNSGSCFQGHLRFSPCDHLYSL